MKFILAATLSVFAITASAQTDNDIVNLLLGEKFINVPNKLKAANIWSHYHFRDTQKADGTDPKDKFMSIQNGAGHTKVWIIQYNKDNVITEVKVNCRHDDRGQVEDIEKMIEFDDHHVGVFSTDFVFRLKK